MIAKSKSKSKLMLLSVVLALAGAGAGCTNSTPQTCSAKTCANGCCDSSGTCVVTETTNACGLNGGLCGVCQSGQQCVAGACAATGGGTAATGGGTAATGGGTAASGGGTATGGGTASDPCATATYTAGLGTLTLDGGAQLTQFGSLPAGVVAVGVSGTKLYGVMLDYTVRPLGSLPSLTVGASLGRVRSPADDATDAGMYLGSSVAVNGTQVLVGATKADQSGTLALVDTTGQATKWVNAPSNFTFARSSTGFLVNGKGLGTTTGAGAYALETVDGGSDGFLYAPFETSWMAASGYTAVTPSGTTLVGYFDNVSFENVVRAVAATNASTALTSRTPLALATASTEILRGSDLNDLAAVGEQAIVVRGGYEPVTFDLFTKQVQRIGLTTTGAVVSATAPVTIVNAPNHCTKVIFATSDGVKLLLGVEDKDGRRLLELAP